MGTPVAKSTGLFTFRPSEQKWLIQDGDFQYLSWMEVADTCNWMPVIVGVGVAVPLVHRDAAVQRCWKERLIQHGFTQDSAGSSSRIVAERDRRIERKSLLRRS